VYRHLTGTVKKVYDIPKNNYFVHEAVSWEGDYVHFSQG